MNIIKRSSRQLDPSRVKELAALAQKIDREEGGEIRERGKEVFRRHAELRSVIDELRACRKSKGISLNELAVRSGISKPNLSRLETNIRMAPTLDTLQRYASAIGKALRIELADAA